MARVSPTMKHARPALTAEQAAIEDFMNTIPPTIVREGDPADFVDNSITEVVDTIDTSLDPIVESTVVAENLDDLATDVDGVTSAVAMESFTRIFHQMCDMSGHPVASIESYKPTKGGVKRLAKDIRAHADMIRGCVNLSFEEYVDKVDESIGTSVSNYKQALGELNRINQDIHVPDGEVVINHKAVWQLFHMNGELMDLRDFSKEVNGVKELTALVAKAKDRLKAGGEGNAIEGSAEVKLMNNTTVKVSNGRAVFNTESAPKPDKEWTGGDWFWVLVFNWAGLVYRIIKGGSGDEKTKKEQSIQAIHKVIDEMKKMAPLVESLEKEAKAVMQIAGDDADKKRAASPILELASKTIAHVTAVTYGAKKMFEKMGE